MVRDSISVAIWSAMGLFMLSEIIHKAFIFNEVFITPAHVFAVVSRILIYAWFSWQLTKAGCGIWKFTLAIILMSLFEFIVIGATSAIAFGIVYSMELIQPAFAGIVFSYPLVLASVLLECLLVFGIVRWWISRRNMRVES